MFSLNVPVPGRVERLAADLAPALAGLDAVRERHTLVLKRLDAVRERHTLVLKRLDADPASRGPTESRVREALSDAAPVEARVTGIDAFPDPVAGPGPVCYLAVESPGLCRIHRRLVDALGAVEGVEGDAYVPHVTLGRGGPPDALDRLCGRGVEPVTWIVRGLEFWDARRGERAGTVALR